MSLSSARLITLGRLHATAVDRRRLTIRYDYPSYPTLLSSRYRLRCLGGSGNMDIVVCLQML